MDFLATDKVFTTKGVVGKHKGTIVYRQVEDTKNGVFIYRSTGIYEKGKMIGKEYDNIIMDKVFMGKRGWQLRKQEPSKYLIEKIRANPRQHASWSYWCPFPVDLLEQVTKVFIELCKEVYGVQPETPELGGVKSDGLSEIDRLQQEVYGDKCKPG
jgi:hypothetical protein